MNFRKITLFSVLVLACGLLAPGAESIVGKWTYRHGTFTDVHVYHADGTVTAPSSAAASAKWRIEGDEIVTSWHNQWSNRLKLPVANGVISGVSISPTGVRAAVTLTRIGSELATASPGAESIVGKWTYRQGAFTDVHVYHADGTVTAPSSAAASAKWRIEGDEIVTSWHNQWTNRLKLPVANGVISGVSISPTGVRAAVTLTRIGPVSDNAPLPSLTGAWVHSADPRTQTPDSKVIVVQDGEHVTLTQSYKTNGRWVTLVCQGTLSGRNLKMQCDWAPGGNPFGFANGTMNLKLSSDGNHLDGTNMRWAGGGSQESHYSRLR